jgi:hypothetical protein
LDGLFEVGYFSSFATSGKAIETLVPFPNSEAILSVPPCRVTIACTIESPRHAPATSVVDKYFVQTTAQSRQKGCYEQAINKEPL